MMANLEILGMAKGTGEIIKAQFTLTAMNQVLKGVKQRAKATALAMAKGKEQRRGINRKGPARNVYIVQKKVVGLSDVQL